MGMQTASNLNSAKGLRKRLAPHAVATSASTAITGTTETAANFDNSYTIPANTLRVGQCIRFMFQGVYTATTGAETHTLAAMLGTQALYTSGNLDPADAGHFLFTGLIQIRTIGASGTFVAAGLFGGTGASGALAPLGWYLGSTAIDTTTSKVVAVQIDRQGTATDSDSARVDIALVEILG